MTKHLWKLSGVIGIASVQIGCAHTACDDLDQQFVLPRIAKIELLDAERIRALVHDGGGNFHSGARNYSAALATSAARAMACARYSGACAPDTANFPPKMKQGTPSMPASLAESASCSISATSRSLTSASLI